jgi:hypothetical protein
MFAPIDGEVEEGIGASDALSLVPQTGPRRPGEGTHEGHRISSIFVDTCQLGT